MRINMSDSVGEQRSKTNQERNTDVTGGANDNFKAMLEKLIQDQNKNRDKSQIPITPPRPKETENPLQNISCTPSISRTGISCPPAPVILLLPPPPMTKETQRTPENVSAAYISKPLRVPPPPPVPRYDDPRPLIPPPILPPRTNSLRSSVPPSRTNGARQINQNVSTLDFVGLPSGIATRLLPPPKSHQQQNRSQTIPSTSDSVDGPASVVTPPLVSPPKSNRSKPLRRKLSSQSFRKRFPFLFSEKKREEASCDTQENKSTPEVVKKERFNEADVDAYMLLEPAMAALKIEIPVDKVRRAIKEKLEQTGCGFTSEGDLIDYVFKQEGEEGPCQAIAPRQVNEIDIQLCLRSEPALAALNIPLSLRRVKQAIKDKLERTGCNFASLEALTEAALNLPEEKDPLGAPPEENKPPSEERLCIICMNAEICVVFVPCGHLRTCPECSKNINICPLCRCPIESTVRTFLP